VIFEWHSRGRGFGSYFIPCSDFPFYEKLAKGDSTSGHTLPRIEVAQHDIDHGQFLLGFVF
jgi:hypothetical protein